MSNIKRKTASYKSFVEYMGVGIGQKEVSVNLSIDFANKTFSVMNEHGNPFTFINGTMDSAKTWKAVLSAIDQAIDYANKELEK